VRAVHKAKSHRITFRELAFNQALWRLVWSVKRLKPADLVAILRMWDRSAHDPQEEVTADSSPHGLAEIIEKRLAARETVSSSLDVLSHRSMVSTDPSATEENVAEAVFTTLRATAAD